MGMKVVAIISQKGGAGKTTLALNLAVASELADKPAAIFDLDPQASSIGWKDSRESESPAVLSLHAARIDHYLDMARSNGAALVIFDTAPHSQKDALDAAQAADIILIPCKPSLVDLRAISSSVKIAQLAGKPAIAVLTQTQARGNLTDEAAEAINSYGIPLAPVSIGNRMAFVHAFTVGKGVLETEPSSKASDEITALYSFIISTIERMKNGKPQPSRSVA
jgi:chromosome partitioning protein